jgi:hypothetical protein
MAQDLLGNKFEKLSFDNEFQLAQESLKDLQQIINHYQVLKNNPSEYVPEFFGNLRNKVDLVKEDLIQKHT